VLCRLHLEHAAGYWNLLNGITQHTELPFKLEHAASILIKSADTVLGTTMLLKSPSINLPSSSLEF
jgi:hypothetical protein